MSDAVLIMTGPKKVLKESQLEIRHKGRVLLFSFLPKLTFLKLFFVYANFQVKKCAEKNDGDEIQR